MSETGNFAASAAAMSIGPGTATQMLGDFELKGRVRGKSARGQLSAHVALECGSGRYVTNCRSWHADVAGPQ